MTEQAKGAEQEKGARRSKGARQDPLRAAMEGDFPEAFMFEAEGTMIIGKVIGFGKGFSEYGPHLVVTLQSEDDGETYSVHCMQTALRRGVLEADPKPGDRLAIKYVGEEVAKSGKRAGKTYKNFRVRVDSPTRSAADIMRGIETDDDDDMPF